ncbi:MAG: sensor histidine kinase [Anaerolineales bacterium]
MNMSRSLTIRLIIAFLLVGLSGSILVTLVVWQSTRNQFDQFIVRRQQEVLINSLMRYYLRNGSWNGINRAILALDIYLGQNPGNESDFQREWHRFTLVDENQIIVYSINPNQIGQKISNRDLSQALTLSLNGRTIGWVLADPINQPRLPNSPETRFLQSVKAASLISAFVAVVLALILGSVLAFTLTRSLRELTDATQEIARGQYGRQVTIHSRDELGKLAESFNQMSRQLERATQSRRQMTADIAHDLRSPLSVIQGYTEALSDGKLEGNEEIYTILHQETQHLSHLVEDLRLLSLADAGELPLTPQAIQPAVLFQRAQARHTLSAQQKGITLTMELQEPLPEIRVDLERMLQVLDNLIINSLRYTPSGGKITLEAWSEKEKVFLQVRDNGKGIATEDLPYVFDRFYRADRSRQENGESGLGLAIAKSLVEAHGGMITVESQLGSGSIFTIQLPKA